MFPPMIPSVPGFARPVVAFLFLLLTVSPLGAAESSSVPPAEVQRRTAAFEAARKAMAANPEDPALVADFARTAFDRCEVLAEGPVVEAVSTEAAEACRTSLKGRPAEARLHYYLGLNLGQLARTRSLGALRLVRQMEKAWLTARTLDESFDFAGADRSLGLLYAECPRPPIGVGSREKARGHLARAVELAPDHPENRLYFAEQLVRWGDREAARNQLASLEKLLPDARRRLTGPDWEPAWVAWDARLATLRERLSTRR